MLDAQFGINRKCARRCWVLIARSETRAGDDGRETRKILKPVAFDLQDDC